MAVKSLKTCLRQVEHRLKVNNIDDALSNAKFLVAHVLGQKVLSGTELNKKITKSQWTHLKQITEERLSGKPVQYIVSDWDFRYLTLQMRPPVFIPRPETEGLIGRMLETEEVRSARRFLEVGCGSGALSLSLLCEHKQLEAVAIDISEDACELTRQNADLNGLSSRISVMNEQIKGLSSRVCSVGSDQRFDFIISNPPYISQEDMKLLPKDVVNFEDHRALYGGVDGLAVVKDILNEVPHLLHNNRSVWLEVDSKHPEILKELVDKGTWKGVKYVRTIEDMRHMPRFCHLHYND